MVISESVGRLGANPPPREHIGGMRWRYINATRPFARLTIQPHGICIGPRPARFRSVLRFLGLPTFNLIWSEIGTIQHARGASPLPGNDGISFEIKRRSLIFWCGASSEAEAILDELAQYVPEKIADFDELKWVVP